MVGGLPAASMRQWGAKPSNYKVGLGDGSSPVIRRTIVVRDRLLHSELQLHPGL